MATLERQPEEAGCERPPLPRRSTRQADQVPANGRADQWYRGSTMILAGAPEQAVVLRRRVGRGYGLPPATREVVQLLASELFANAVRHSRSGLVGGEVTVSVFRLAECIQVKVTDDGPSPGNPEEFPRLRPMDPVDLGQENGLGLYLVHTQATCWGAHREEDGRTTVWFECDF